MDQNGSNKRPDVCFTILHYLAADVTKRCADSLLKLSGIDNCKVIILDNGSPNDSFAELEAAYKDDRHVDLYQCKENLGFTKGNNYLYACAKKYQPRCAVVLNNDIVIEQKDFISTLLRTADESGAYMIGVDVYAPYIHGHQGPLYTSLPSIEAMEEEMSAWGEIVENGGEKKKNEISFKLHLLAHRIMPEWLIETLRKIRRSEQKDCEREIVDPVIQGSCIIATDRYMDREDVLFEPDTRFYFEEMLLALKCKTKGYHTLYTPKLQVIHHHAVASRMESGKYSEYMLTQAKRMLHGFGVYKETLENNPWLGQSSGQLSESPGEQS